jgi:hypothetical protein
MVVFLMTYRIVLALGSRRSTPTMASREARDDRGLPRSGVHAPDA